MSEFRKNSLKLLFVSCIGFLLSWGLYYYFMGRDFKNHVHSFQQSINKLDKDIDLFFNHYEDVLKSDHIWENENLLHHSFFCFVLEDEKLTYWNSDVLPIQDSSKVFSSAHPRLVHLSNGYYYVKSISLNRRNVFAGKKIMSNYFYENENLKTTLSPDFKLPQEIEIDFNEGYAIKNNKGEALFYITPRNIGNIGLWKESIIFISFITALIAFLLAVNLLLNRLPTKNLLKLFVFPLLIILVWFLTITFNVFTFFRDFELFAPDLFAASTFFSDLGMTIIEFIFLGFIMHWIIVCLNLWHKRIIQKEKESSSHKILTIGLFILVFPYAYFINWFAESLVINSSISFELDNLFALSIFSYIGLFLMAILFIFYILVFKKITHLLLSTLALNTIAVICFIFGIIYLFIDLFYGENPLISAIWPLLINSLILYSVYKNKIKTTTWALFAIALFSLYTTLNFYEFSVINEHQKRQFFADQIISDRDVTLELEFDELIHNIRHNDLIKYVLAEQSGLSQNTITDSLEDCCLSSFWDRYDIRLYLFNEAGEDLLDYVENQSLTIKELNSIISTHGEESEIRKDLFYITDYHNRLSYLSRVNLSFEDKHRIIYFAFRSKKIPEEIGIPRLLLNRSSHILDDLENYSIARYSENELLMRFGDFNFPTTKSAFLNNIGTQLRFSSFEGNSIYVREGDNNQLVVITKPLKTFFEQLTGFSYTFIFYCLVLVFIFLLDGKFSLLDFVQLNLATKIQVVLIGLIVLSFVLFGTVTGSYVRQQYGYFSNDNLKERLQSVHIELKQKLGDKDNLDPDLVGTYMEYILKKFSTVFVTDINLYDNSGKLLASSQPSLYTRGISSTQINPKAFVKMIHRNKSDFIHTESIGNLNYLSAYKPFLNNQNKQLGLINIKHFSKQRQYENQITGFLVAIINIAVLLLILTVIVALLVSKWITTPLRLIQQSFKTVDIGKQNKPIEYKRNDEIGALVKDYNDKLIELELKAMQLARNERETAWREMAKQVAHEIKNPLTPMKLRLQHFQRAFDPNDPDAKNKISQITSSLVEQIDGLTKIANEFSNFAKMPKANEQAIDLIPILKNGVDLFGDENGSITFDSDLSEAIVWADKDLFIRVVNNILKNAFQAVPEETTPDIKVEIKEDGKHYLISFKDNGKGISEDDKHKIFVPNFTTKSTGAGLGLAMVKQIIQNHNGEIWFENNRDKGTTFFVLVNKYESYDR
jgi:signal transduction histidine kinase